jgi:hypothetical protein
MGNTLCQGQNQYRGQDNSQVLRGQRFRELLVEVTVSMWLSIPWSVCRFELVQALDTSALLLAMETDSWGDQYIGHRKNLAASWGWGEPQKS